MNADYRTLWKSAGGNTPPGWDFVSIGDLLETPRSISVGVMYPGPDTPGGVPLIRVADVKDGAISQRPDFCVSKEVDEEYKRTRLNGSELLITLVGNPGDCVIVTREMAGWNAARALAVVRLKDPSLRPWLRYVLLSKPAKHLIDARLNTTVQKTLNLKDIKELAVPLPTKEERDRISGIIARLEGKAKLNRQINQTLEEMAQAIFTSWFVDFEPVKAKIEAKANGQDPERAAMCTISGAVQGGTNAAGAGRAGAAKTNAELDQLPPVQLDSLRATAALFPDELTDSELGPIPKGWAWSTIGKEVDVVGGGTPSTKNPDFWEGGCFHWTTPKDLSGNQDKILLTTERQITKAGLGKISSGLLPVDTVLLSSRAPVGYLALAKVPVAVNQGYIAMKCTRKLPPVYVLQWANSVMDDIKQRASGTTFAEISKKNFRIIPVMVATEEVLNLYHQKVNYLYDKITESLTEMTTLAELRDTLLPQLLSGKIDLTGIVNV